MFSPSKGYLIFDPELCTGCCICEAICSFTKEGCIRPELSRIRVHVIPFGGTVENAVPQMCLQCETPHCMMACPVEGAMVVDPHTGARIIHTGLCPAGCRKCLEACASHIDPPRIRLHPEKGIPLKCDLCQGTPECVKWCPNGAIRYISYSVFVEKGKVYSYRFTEAFEKDFGPSYGPFEGPQWRYKGPWITEE